MSLPLKLLAPWLSTFLFWCIFENAWLALLGYHIQIIFWNRQKLPSLFSGLFITTSKKALMVFALPAIVAGPAMYFLLPWVIEVPLAQWLSRYQLSGLALLLMVPYFGFIHPLLEQLHWAPLRNKTPIAHIMFAGYHLVVLATLLPMVWLIIAFVTLAAVSIFWQRISIKEGGLTISCCSHILADFGIVTAACILAY